MYKTLISSATNFSMIGAPGLPLDLDRFTAALLATRFPSASRKINRIALSSAIRSSDWREVERYLGQLDRRAIAEGVRILEEARRSGFQTITLGANFYPERLAGIPDPPLVLFMRGTFPRTAIAPVDGQFTVGIVGSRDSTSYGNRHARSLAEAVTVRGGVVISGLAIGIDGAAHRGAISGFDAACEQEEEIEQSAGIAVLGSGLHRVYPAQHQSLADEIIKRNGVLLSEYLPDQPGLPQQFPERNRIVSGLADALVVVEAKERSGALGTVQCALEQGRDVFALPGPLDYSTSAGPHRLIREGAILLRSIDDIFDAIPRLVRKSKKPRRARKQSNAELPTLPAQLQDRERAVAEQLLQILRAGEPQDFEQLMALTATGAPELQAALSQLELHQIVFRGDGDFYSCDPFV